MRFRLLTYIASAFLLCSTLTTKAQVVEGKSRLGIGQQPKKTATTTSYAASARVPSEIRLNKATTVNQFYRQLLLSNTNKKTPAATENKAVVADIADDDYLYATDKVKVSRLYPNPANDFAKLDFKISGNSKVSVVFHDLLLTNKVASFDLDAFDSDLTVHTRNWKQGIYLYQLVVDGKKVATKKLIVQHN